MLCHLLKYGAEEDSQVRGQKMKAVRTCEFECPVDFQAEVSIREMNLWIWSSGERRELEAGVSLIKGNPSMPLTEMTLLEVSSS